MSDAPLRPVLENPFYVLGLPPTATRAEIEREGQKLLGLLTVGLDSASHYQTPMGPRPRTSELVRWAMHELRDPHQRLVHTPWAVLPTNGHVRSEAPKVTFPDGLSAIGWDFPC
ncbi:MAG TPA: hypothetical protein VGO93_28380 [Candidatus Xenobia bacterium]|jgi:hypothetical protein